MNIKELIIEWIYNNYELYLNFFSDDDINNISKDTLAEQEFN